MPTPRRTSRRTAVLGSLGVGVATMTFTACDTDDLRPPDADSPVTPSASAAGRPTADEALVNRAAGAIRTAAVTVVAARLVPTLRRPLTPLLRDHRRHLATLDEAGATLDPASTAADPATALAEVRTAEQALQQQLVGFAVQAESGTLAALLASMSASVAQHLAALGPAT